MPRARNAAAAGLSAAGRGLDQHEKSIQTEIRDLERQLESKKAELSETVRVHREISALGGSAPRVAVAARRASAGRRGQAQPATRGRRRQAQAQPTTRRPSAGRPTAARSTDERVEQIRKVLAKGPMTASEIATATSMSQQRARQLMAFMIEKRLVTSTEQPSGRGRPRLVFTLSGRGASAGRSRPAASASASGGRTKTKSAAARKRGAGRPASGNGRKRKPAAAAAASTGSSRRGSGTKEQTAAPAAETPAA